MIRVQENDFDPGAEIARLTAGRTDVGGVATFLGLVRGESNGLPLLAMTLEHYPGMTERRLAEIEQQARHRWLLCDVLILHRVGRLRPGEHIVLVATLASHRLAAFDACQFLIDWLKTRAPFWKLEETARGTAWVEARTTDTVAAARWEQSQDRVQGKQAQATGPHHGNPHGKCIARNAPDAGHGDQQETAVNQK